jgi:NADPH-dependent glutamate synthase beta subunit-like oxidoreductase
VSTGKKVGIVGGGVAGLSAAWQLARKGHEVFVFDDAEKMGGKLEQVIPRGRLSHDLLEAELKRIEEIGVKFGLTRERVRQIKEKAIRKLRGCSKNKILKTFLG